MRKTIYLLNFTIVASLALPACSTAKLESRLEANPQCKDVYNAKTGALMPCPGSDRSFYVAAGLETPRQAKPTVASNPAPSPVSSNSPLINAGAGMPASESPVSASQTSPAAQSDCKPTIHKKTGGMLPCPPLD
jgi:hypothetical protein